MNNKPSNIVVRPFVSGKGWPFGPDAAPAAAPDGWPDPAPIAGELPAVEALVPEMLPPALGHYIADAADRSSTPADFIAVSALAGAAALVGNRVRVRPKFHDDWTVTPNLWGAIIGPPSAMKSPALAFALRPLHKLEGEAAEAFAARETDHAAEQKVADLVLAAATQAAKTALKEGDRAAANRLIADAMASAPKPPTARRLIANNASVEKLGELLNQNPRGLLMVRDELAGFLAKLETEDGQADRAFYLEAYNGDSPFTYDRIGRGTVRIEISTVSLIGGIQPARLAPMVRDTLSGAKADGFLQRLQLAVWPDISAEWAWTDRAPNAAAADAYSRAMIALDDLDIGTTKAPAFFHFDQSAQGLFAEWMTDLHRDARSGSQSEAMEAHLLKTPKTIASLALIFELLGGGRVSIGEPALIRALGWADYLRSHASRIYASGGAAAETAARLILSRRDRLPASFRARDVHRKQWAGLADREDVEAALTVLEEAHVIRSRAAQGGADGGRPSVTYDWNPKLGNA